MGQLKLPKPKAIILDISGTAAKTSFIEKVLMPYIKSAIKDYVEEKWTEKQFIKDLERLRAQSQKDDESVPKIAGTDAELATQQQSVIDYVLWYSDNKKESRAHQMFRFHLWFDGYEKNKISTPVYSDVAIQMKKWKCDQNIKFYVFSNGWIEATKRFMSKTSHGDLNPLIDDYFDTNTVGALSDKQSFTKILAKIGEQPENVIFLTKSGEEARAAKEAGITPVLVLTHRRNIEKLDEVDKQFQKIRSFNELEFE
jgi:enolase-phosphatase E1